MKPALGVIKPRLKYESGQWVCFFIWTMPIIFGIPMICKERGNTPEDAFEAFKFSWERTHAQSTEYSFNRSEPSLLFIPPVLMEVKQSRKSFLRTFWEKIS